ncbi:MAG: hypothetical protein C4B59_10155, partial [Candidatus Methanogaster sp.]
ICRGCASEEPDEGNLQVRFCEGAHSNLGAITPERGALCALLDKKAERKEREIEKLSTKHEKYENETRASALMTTISMIYISVCQHLLETFFKRKDRAGNTDRKDIQTARQIRRHANRTDYLPRLPE